MIEDNIGDGYSYNHNYLGHNSTMAEVMVEKGLCVLNIYGVLFNCRDYTLYISITLFKILNNLILYSFIVVIFFSNSIYEWN